MSARTQADNYQSHVAAIRAAERIAHHPSPDVRNSLHLIMDIAANMGAHAINEYLWIANANDETLLHHVVTSILL